MTFANFPTTFEQVKDWTWDDIRPYFDDLLARELNAATAESWLRDRSQLEDAIREIFSRTQVATTQDTADEEAEARYKNLLATVYPHLEQTGNALDRMLLDSGLQPDGLEMALKKIRTDVEIFREENIELHMREQVLGLEFNKIAGALTVEWEGAETTLPELGKVQEDHDRDRRERAWRLSMERYLSVREPINAIWMQLFDLRAKKAQNAGFDNYRSYIWQVRHRYDYTPQDADTFHRAIEEVVLPAVQRRTEARRARLGLDVLRPWDLIVDPDGRAPIRPWESIDDFAARAETIFNNVDPELGAYFSTMRREELLDLPNRKNKGVGAYCTGFPMSKRPFVFMNAVNSRVDVRTLLHEIGHAFHNFEALANLQYSMQRAYPIEFAEVASMAMELLAGPYLTRADGGYFSEADAARDRIEHLEKILDFWPYMAVVDAFQHWAYTHGSEAADPAACDAAWSRLWDRFMVTADYSGMQDIKETGWHRKHHIFRYPFYYIEYGLAQLGAVQVWANALEDQAAAVRAYRSGLALGGTRNLYELFGATGAKFAFDSQTLGAAVDLIERTINDLEEKSSAPMLTLYFVRHGQSEANVEHVISNRGRVHGLTALGREQAAQTAAALAGAGIARIFSSPLLRAEQTAAILSEAWGVPYEVTDALREYDCGVLEGQSDPLSWDRHRAVWERWMNHGDFDFRAEGGESYRDIEARFVPFVHGLIAAYGEHDTALALVSHGGTLRAALPLVLANVDLAFAKAHGLRNVDTVRAELHGDRLLCRAWGETTLE